jgi:hypothetical protein
MAGAVRRRLPGRTGQGAPVGGQGKLLGRDLPRAVRRARRREDLDVQPGGVGQRVQHRALKAGGVHRQRPYVIAVRLLLALKQRSGIGGLIGPPGRTFNAVIR